jgi:transposase
VSRSRTVDLRWNALLNDFRRSGLTQAEFCRRRQVSLHSFRKHLYQPRLSKPAPGDDRSAARADHHFLPVTILPDPIPSITASQSHLELVLSNGRRIAVAPGFDPQTLRRLIAVVEERPCSD